jgi:hypothetical protein
MFIDLQGDFAMSEPVEWTPNPLDPRLPSPRRSYWGSFNHTDSWENAGMQREDLWIIKAGHFIPCKAILTNLRAYPEVLTPFRFSRLAWASAVAVFSAIGALCHRRRSRPSVRLPPFDRLEKGHEYPEYALWGVSADRLCVYACDAYDPNQITAAARHESRPSKLLVRFSV